MSDTEEILEEVLEEKRKHGFQARVLRSQELLTLRIELEKQEHGVSMLIAGDDLLKIYKMKNPEEKRKWAEGVVQLLMRELQRYIEM